ncbi:hypothetical protein B0A55_12148 [Friedmanniomyces simplex]|uniref:Uncharacterized protein n=1 Tax=Friedmanniomyces simplex TaxID=329884 RepID=A0A4U0W8Y4_9PEZI|nr:hypothetical protein B0A55_12148 [Friedmanniomyces simplex]
MPFRSSKAARASNSLASTTPSNKNKPSRTARNAFGLLSRFAPDSADDQIAEDLDKLTLTNNTQEQFPKQQQQYGNQEPQYWSQQGIIKPPENVDCDTLQGWTQAKGRLPSSFSTGLKTGTVITAHIEQLPGNTPWLDSDWRAHDPKVERARWAAATTIKTVVTRGKYRPGPRTRSGVLFADQKAGTIVFHPEVRPYPSKKIPDTDPSITFQNGVRFRTKGRYWLIVKSTAKSVWEVPIYTNGDTGLANVKKKHWSKYYSLRPDTVAPKDFQNQSPNNTPWSIGYMNEHQKTMKGRKMRKTMVVRITEVYRRAIDDADVKIVGALEDVDIPIAVEKTPKYIVD